MEDECRLNSIPVIRLSRIIQFGKYNLITRLAKGGMAEIFLASLRDTAEFEKLVVIKRMLPSLASRAVFLHIPQ